MHVSTHYLVRQVYTIYLPRRGKILTIVGYYQKRTIDNSGIILVLLRNIQSTGDHGETNEKNVRNEKFVIIVNIRYSII